MKCRCSYIKKVENIEGIIEAINSNSKYNCYFSSKYKDRDGYWHRGLGYIVTNIYTLENCMYFGRSKEVWK